jgi:uncharacterized membrane protein
MFKDFVASITHNVISLIGTALAVASLVLMACLFAMEQFGFEGGPYIGILTYLILPMFFVVGLLLIPIGAVLYRRKMRRLHGKEAIEAMPVFDLNKPATQRWTLIFVGATMLNIVILPHGHAAGTYGPQPLTAFAGGVRRLSHRPRCRLVREVEAGRCLAARGGCLRPVSAPGADTAA